MKNYTRFLTAVMAFLVLTSPISVVAQEEGELFQMEEEYKPSPNGIDYPEATLNKYVEWTGEGNEYNVTLEILGKEKIEESAVDVVFVLDTSGSMDGSRIDKLKSAMKDLSKKLLEYGGFSLGAVSYSTAVNSTLDMTTDYTTFETYIDGLTATGGTFTQAGLKAAEEMMETRADETMKIIILISDGVPTYSYKVTGTEPIVDNEVRPYNQFNPTFKTTSWDYTTRVGVGNLYALYNDAHSADGNIIRDNGDPTIGEILEYKEKDNTKVMAVGVELLGRDMKDEWYTFDYEPKDDTEKEQLRDPIVITWDEDVRDGVLSPNEKATFTAEYTAPEAANGKDIYFTYIYSSSFWLEKMKPFLKDPDAKCITVRHNGEVVGTYTYEEYSPTVSYNPPPGVKVRLATGDVYSVEVALEMSDYALDTLPFWQFEHGAWGVWVSSYLLVRIMGTWPVFINFERYAHYKTDIQGEYLLKNIASDGIEGESYFNVEDDDNLYEVLVANVYSQIIDSVAEGKIEDPLGLEYISFVPDGMSGESFVLRGEHNGQPDDAILEGIEATYDEATNQINVTGLNLGVDEKLYITYRVRLDVEEAGFEIGKLYQTNNTAKLIPYDGSEARNFPDPKVGVSQKNEKYYTINYYDCDGNLIAQDWVQEGELATPPSGYAYPPVTGGDKNVDVYPVNCGGGGFLIPNTGIGK